ncbi:DUF523 domain-containing protein [Effusibacillus dendaii]|uniref:DUF523 domain-containing protein n=1 Tax=Effusibacillus dendaii TaxID=2743772 RepID=A0A7I8D7W1_9BACL|nr:DUF523 domain-containing protein [Effusibacillus dendaii]BCJ85472.1 hypothetical protein skT53_04570 [Effusibacillus dendaii]
MKVVSACLVGCECRYDKKSAWQEDIEQFVTDRSAVPICPEQLGGLPTPRNPAEIVGGDGFDVLAGRARVIDSQGNVVTKEFVDGAYQALQLARTAGATEAILKERSPSCGSHMIYDGSFSGAKKAGVGVTAALFMQNGIAVFPENEKR